MLAQIKSFSLLPLFFSAVSGTWLVNLLETDRMWMTGTRLGMRSEILVSDLEHICDATKTDEVINLGSSTSRGSYC